MSRPTTIPGSILISLLLSAAIFTLLFFIARPIYFYEEDVYVAYQLAGGFGNSPTCLLHFNHLMNPALGAPLSVLFSNFGKVNWYSLSIYCSYYVSLFAIVYALTGKGFQLKYMFLCVMICVVFAGWIFMNVGFSSASVFMTIAAMALLFQAAIGGNLSPRRAVLVSALFVVASLYRIHTMIPLLGIGFPILWRLVGKGLVFRTIIIFGSTISMVFLFHLAHLSLYKAKLKGWEQEENYRAKVYDLFNNAKSTSYSGKLYSDEFELYKLKIFGDTTYMSSEKLTEMRSIIQQIPAVVSFRKGESGYWWLINNRLYFLLTFIFIITGLLFSQYRIEILLSTVLLISGCVYMVYFAKLPDYIIITCSFLLSMFCLQCLQGSNDHRMRGFWLYPLVFLFSAWGVIRVYKQGIINAQTTEKFVSGYELMSQHPGSLFINLGGAFPLEWIPVKAPPRKYPLFNFMDTDHYLLQLHEETLLRFGIERFADIPLSNKVFFWGKPNQGLLNYFRLVTGKELRINNEPFPGHEIYSISVYLRH